MVFEDKELNETPLDSELEKRRGARIMGQDVLTKGYEKERQQGRQGERRGGRGRERKTQKKREEGWGRGRGEAREIDR